MWNSKSLSKFAQYLGFTTSLCLAQPGWSATLFVTTNADSGAGSLRNAMNTAVNGDVIQIQPFLTGGQTISLSSDLPAINQSIEIHGPVGNTVAIDGDSQHRAFFVKSGTVVIDNLNIQNMQTVGGKGADHTSGGGGGGGLGAGAGLYVNDGATVFLSKTNFIGNEAIGGDAGVRDASLNASGGGGGGGFGGHGGHGGVDSGAIGGGGGGGGGFSADGANAGAAPAAGAGGAPEGGNGGLGANGGAAVAGSDASAPFGAGGGGGSGATLVAGAKGGKGEHGGGGGGGGATTAAAVPGGDGGDGGFGAGGGGGASAPGLSTKGTGGVSTYGGGSGNDGTSLSGGRGGGGAAFGGAVIVAANGTLNIVEPGFLGNSVISGSGGSPLASGPDLFLMSDSNTTVSVPQGEVLRIASGIGGDNVFPGGGLTVTGLGRLDLEGVNTYYVPTTVSAGHLHVTGSILNSTVTVLQNGKITGNGPVNTLINEGTIIPGNPIGILSAVNYLQSPTARFVENITPRHSLNILSVSNNVQLTGGLLEVHAARGFYAAGKIFPVIEGGFVNGAFDTLTSPIDLSIHYTDDSVFLRTNHSQLYLDGFRLRCNARRVFDYINSLDIPVHSGLAHTLLHLPIDPIATPAALDELHPALFQDLTLATGENLYNFRKRLTSRNEYIRYMRNKRYPGLFNNACNIGVTPYWVSLYDAWIDQANRGCLRGYKATSPGIAMGFDSQPNRCFITGIAMAYTFTDLHWRRHPGKKGKATIESIYLGAYSSWFNKYCYLDASFVGSYEWYSVKRNITWICRKAKNRHKGYAMDAHIGGGLRFNSKGLMLEPFACVDYEFVDQDGYRETGARSLDLRVKANHSHLLRSEAGVCLSQVFNYNCARVRPNAFVSYVRKEILQGERFKSKFLCADSYFDAVGTRVPLNMINPGLGLEIQFHNNYIFSMNYDAELNRKQTIQNLIVRFERAY